MVPPPVAAVPPPVTAADDEVRHVRVTASLARRYSGTVTTPNIDAPQRRSLAEMALENAVDGCVRETFGTLVAHHQALMARDEGIVQVMPEIAEDEMVSLLVAF